MSESIALIGFVNTEEILADNLRLQTPDITVDGYELFPNDAFGRIVNQRYKLYDGDSSQTDDDRYLKELKRLGQLGYDAINLGPDTGAFILEDHLSSLGVNYIGPRRDELDFELDKTKIFDIFPDSSSVLPPTKIVEADDLSTVRDIVDGFSGEVYVKFVGDYADYYDDSEYRRVRSADEFVSFDELNAFVCSSVASSGRAIIQKKVSGQEFSYTCLVDANGGIYRLGENKFYKRRNEGDNGPLCDGTGSLAINNTLPHLLSKDDIQYVEDNIVRRYISVLGEQNRRSPQTFLNVDLMKDDKGKIYLLEINNRQPGGHTMSTLLAGLESPLSEALFAAQESRLAELKPRYKTGATMAVTIFPEIAPGDFADERERPIVTIPKNRPDDRVRIYTGWVDLLSETDESATVQTNLTATMIAVNHDRSLETARHNVYSKIAELGLSGAGLTYRHDIGLI